MALVSALLASCSTNDPSFDTPGPSFAGEAGASAQSRATTDSETFAVANETSTSLPETVAYVPLTKPADVLAELETVTAATENGGPAPDGAEKTDSRAQAAPAAASDAQAQSAAANTGRRDEPAGSARADYPVYVTATDPDQKRPPAISQKKKSLFSSLFGSTPANAAPSPLIAAEPQPKAVVELASTGSGKAGVKTASITSDDDDGPTIERLDALPGVRQSALFEIRRRSGIDDDSDIDLHEDEDYGPVRVATAAGLARLAPNGLITQTGEVDVACLKPSLVRVLKTAEQHYARKLVVTSGYRSPSHNRRARGAKNSLHMFCAAADIQVPGVSKWELASYFRSMQGRGGVGTYCHTESVHVDVGPERDWNWKCRRRKS